MANDAYIRELMELAKNAGIALDLRCNVSDRELVRLYSAASLFLYAPRLEPFGLAPLEASACGLVTVGVAEAGTREGITVGENGFLVPADEALFARKIDDLLADRPGLEDMAALARDCVVRKWSMQEAVRRLERVLSQLAMTAQTKYDKSRDSAAVRF
jgi:glycosyltransferase involved in cell wall biosynthesis